MGDDRRLKALAADIAAAGLPARIAFMRLAMATASPDELAATLTAAEAVPGIEAIAAVAAAHPDGWGMVKTILTLANHDALAKDAAERMAEVARIFDAACAISPEAGVALYSLGDRAALAAATAEIVGWMAGRGIVQPTTRLLDFGCGIGRLALALAPVARSITAVDVSAGMVAEAKCRCAGFGNVGIVQIGGLDLAPFGTQSFDAVVALDSMPYVVGQGGRFAGDMLAEMLRVLAPGGHLAIFNYSYRGDASLDSAELGAFAASHGLAVLGMGERPFSLWDGAAFHLRRSEQG